MRSHGSTLDGIPVDDALKQKLTTDFRELELSQTNRLILDYATIITHEAHKVDQAYIDTLKAHGFTDQMLHDVVAVAAYFNFVNRLADALGVELEGE